MKTVIEMAREVYGVHTEWTGAPLDRLTQFAEIVRADERERIEHAAIGSVKAAILYEREACAQVVWEMKGQCWAYDHDTIVTAIRARSNT